MVIEMKNNKKKSAKGYYISIAAGAFMGAIAGSAIIDNINTEKIEPTGPSIVEQTPNSIPKFSMN